MMVLDAETLCMARACVAELTARRALLAVGSEQANAECNTLEDCIHELEVDAVTSNGE